MESVNAVEAHKFLNTTRFLYNVNLTCYEKCAIDF